ncbi:MAG: M10 family metallopeptidase C-terminal domain-containing protein, partial [Psychrobacter sp.]|nr:M10 family metallopeptidase C-terminal domain-containing protein [Psychrobacter sp.]
NNPETRLEAAEDLAAWLATDPTGTGDTDNLVIGDFNGYSKEDALMYLEDNGYDKLSHDYSYSYDGLWGSLDHAFVSDSLGPQVTGVADWAINANEAVVLDYNTNYKSDAQQQSYYDSSAYRASDHNPVLIGLNLGSGAPVDPEPNVPNIPAAEIKGTDSDDNLIGNELDNLICGFAGHDSLDGRLGADIMIGGTGDDTYHIDDIGDQVIELKGSDIDTIVTSVDYSLKDTNVENITAVGNERIALTGNDADNIMMGNDADNTLSGGKGNDTLDGGAGVDTLIGGQGDDVYYIDNAADSITELWWSGHDTVNTAVNFDLRMGSIEDAAALGCDDIALKGNWSDNTLIGNSGDNLLMGRLGDDTLIGGLGQDRLEGGWGRDTFVFTDINDSMLTSSDVIADFKSGQDQIDLSQIDANDATVEDDAFDTLLTADQDFSQAGELKLIDGVLYGNTNNDNIADFAIDLKGHHLAMTDIII